jgi:hypothetical protein
VCVQPSGRRIEPFLDPVEDVPILNRPLGVWQQAALEGAGLIRVPEPRPPCLLVPDNFFATAGALRAFVDGAAGRNAVLVLKRSLFGRTVAAVRRDVSETEDGWRFNAVRFDDGTGADPVDVVVDPDEKIVELPALEHYYGSDKIEVSLVRHPVFTLHHWVHILWANQFASGLEVRCIPTWKVVLHVAWAALRALSLNRWKLLGKLNRIGRGCDIHPTAIVEGSTLGDGVSVGPHARVLLSHVGDGAMVMPGAQVELSTVGARAVIAQQSVLRFCVLYPEAFMGQYLMQQCILGNQAVTSGGGFSIDLNFEKEIRVPLDGQLHSTGMRFMGSAFGHRCRVGTGLWLASGRAIPNDCFIIRDPRAVLSDVPTDCADKGPVVARACSAEPTRVAAAAGW